MIEKLPPEIASAIESLMYEARAWYCAPEASEVQEARSALDATILHHLSAARARAERAEKAREDSDTVRVPRLFDAEAEEAAWKIWLERGHGHESFVQCINAYIARAALSSVAEEV